MSSLTRFAYFLQAKLEDTEEKKRGKKARKMPAQMRYFLSELFKQSAVFLYLSLSLLKNVFYRLRTT